ncbi:MAG: hypothetical protein PGN13_04800 [Patulibacter minatonensis]
MIDPRLTRIFVLPILAVLVLAAFSVQDRPRGLRTFQAPDAFIGSDARAALNRFAINYPARPTGGPADADAGREIARSFREAGLAPDTWTATVRTERGARQQAIQVSGRSDGPGSGTIVVVAARDSVHAGSRAELTGTAALLQLAAVLGKRRLEHPVELISVSGTPGQAAYRDLADRLASGDEPVRAVIVLGTLGTRDYLAPVSGLSDGPQFASQRLRRTLEDAIAQQRSVGDSRVSAAGQIVRLAAPMTTGGQGPLLRAGLPAILFSTTGDRVAPPEAQVSEDRLQADGRALLRAIIAIDNAGPIDLRPEGQIRAGDGVIPGWALRAIVLALLVLATLLVVDGVARAGRSRVRVGRWVLWTGLLALPQLLGIGAVAAAARVGWIGVPGGPIDPGLWNGDVTPLAIFTITALLGHIALRPLVLLALGLRGMRSQSQGAPLGLSVVLVITALATWVVNPAAAALMVPAVVLWPVVLDSGMRPPRGWGLVVVLAAMAPLLLLMENLLTRYPLGDATSALSWFAVLLGASDVGLFPQLWFAALSGCCIAAVLLARHGRGIDPGDGDVTTRGPVSYAGPGSLGGVPSAFEKVPR